MAETPAAAVQPSFRAATNGTRDRKAKQSVGRRPIDQIDLRILEELMSDARLSVRELAARVSISRANAHWRVARLREEGVIIGFGAEVNPKALGLDVVATIIVSLDQPGWRQAREALEALPEVEYVALTSGAFDCLVIVRAPDVGTIKNVVLERMLAIPQIKSIKSSFVLEEVRRKPVLR